VIFLVDINAYSLDVYLIKLKVVQCVQASCNTKKFYNDLKNVGKI
jgi:hypothetical protein